MGFCENSKMRGLNGSCFCNKGHQNNHNQVTARHRKPAHQANASFLRQPKNHRLIPSPKRAGITNPNNLLLHHAIIQNR
jgi:hypothetical protein